MKTLYTGRRGRGHGVRGVWRGLVAGLILALGLNGCQDPDSPRGFRLPEGDVERGKAAFVELGCVSCHMVQGVAGLPKPGPDAEHRVALGGEVRLVKTYGQLVTSIIYPNHTIQSPVVESQTESPMPDFTEEMTVRQLVDVVTFLQAQYRLAVPDHAYEAYP